MPEHVILVDDSDRPLATCEKLEAHELGLLHRALSVFVFDTRGRMLLQRRAQGKYHAGGLWSNTCCTHPRPGEPTEAAAHRRLREEMGFGCALAEHFSFTYRIALDNNLIEHEYDHVFTGRYDGDPSPNAEEVAGWRWVDPHWLDKDLKLRPRVYTPWLGFALDGLRGGRPATAAATRSISTPR
jgi:isopentenyl-diphosphate delta-isomerase